jgi:hypothetical protein
MADFRRAMLREIKPSANLIASLSIELCEYLETFGEKYERDSGKSANHSRTVDRSALKQIIMTTRPRSTKPQHFTQRIFWAISSTQWW